MLAFTTGLPLIIAAVRKQCVTIADNLSNLDDITFGVPQSSVLAPLLFFVYETVTVHLLRVLYHLSSKWPKLFQPINKVINVNPITTGR